MAQASKHIPSRMDLWRGPLVRGSREALLIIGGAVAMFLALALLSYHPADPGWSHSAEPTQVANRGGVVGAWIADVLLYLFGYMAFGFPVVVAALAWVIFKLQDRELREQLALIHSANAYEILVHGLGFMMTVAAGAGLATLHYGGVGRALPLHAGGVLGDVVARNMTDLLSPFGATLFLLALFLAGFSLCTGLSWITVMDTIGRHTLAVLNWLGSCIQWSFWVVVRIARALAALARAVSRWTPVRGVHHGGQGGEGLEGMMPRLRESALEPATSFTRAKSRGAPRARIEPMVAPKTPRRRSYPAPEIPSPKIPNDGQVELFNAPVICRTQQPPLELLDVAKGRRRPISQQSLAHMSRQVEFKLRDFGVEVEVVAAYPGPVVTRYELRLAPGVKVSRISSLSKDLARSLSTISVRIVEVIPGKSVVGLEIPNDERELVTLSEILRSPIYERSKAELALALGKDIAGHPVAVDLAKMPHLLVAGTTGAGKSVAINAMILSLLYRGSRDDVRMIMIDPKMLELSVYDGIPNLLAPVVTDMKDARNALRWCVGEMEGRYRLMSALGVRNLSGYNRKVSAARARGTPLQDPLHRPQSEGELAPELDELPKIVVVVEEFADLMMVTGKKVEELIARLAQKARAAGIHLILATQRPSVDVITGLIKANIPSRIAFQVSSKVDSRTILDQMGAENLLGHGDMLYLGPGTSTPARVHGAFVSDQEVHRVASHLRSQGPPDYVDGLLEGTALEDSKDVPGLDLGLGTSGGDTESDPLYDQAVRVVTETRRASISGVQRRLKVGYNRAARMLEQMEESGVVGPLQSNGSREVLAPPPPPL